MVEKESLVQLRLGEVIEESIASSACGSMYSHLAQEVEGAKSHV